MTREDLDFIGAMNMCDEISNEAYKKIVCHFEEQELILDKIRSEMQDYSNSFVIAKRNDLASAVSYCIEIIDKYKESEVNE